MFSTEDTIVAIATPPGRGGIGVVRLSGPCAHTVAMTLCGRTMRFAPRHATFSTIRQGNETVDQAIATFFPAPHSYTGDDVVELSAHGSPVVLRTIVTGAIAAGARLAEPGEFTLRAFLNHRIDLPQAEAVADLIDAVTPLQARAAMDQLEGTLTTRVAAIDTALFELVAQLEASVDFPEEGYHFIEPRKVVCALDALVQSTSSLLSEGRRGRMIREGLQVAIVGKPNVGKSSVFNALAGTCRAIVTPTPGTTRDLITETIDLNGMRVTLIDSAGIRASDDSVEAIGVDLARRSMHVADVVVVLVDGSRPLDEMDATILDETAGCRRLVVANKSDLGAVVKGCVTISAKTGAGLDALRESIDGLLDVEFRRDRPAMTNARHLALVEHANDALARARAILGEGGAQIGEELLLADLQDARNALEEIAGKRTPDDLLAHIFSRFCVGK